MTPSTSFTASTQAGAQPQAEPRLWALVPCAGSGSRAATAQPKQYQIVAGQTVLAHTLAALRAVTQLSGVLVVAAPGDSFAGNLVGELNSITGATVSVAGCGGFTRARSVLNGLSALADGGAASHDWVLVHDAARCLVTPGQIDTLIAACLNDDVGGLLALPLPDTLKSGREGRVDQTVDRSDKWLAQTPQMFRLGALRAALEQGGDQITDESSAMEAMGYHPKLVTGSAQNFKVTYPKDFALAENILRARLAQAPQHPFHIQQPNHPRPDLTYDYP